jgi:hypothetical protein
MLCSDCGNLCDIDFSKLAVKTGAGIQLVHNVCDNGGVAGDSCGSNIFLKEGCYDLGGTKYPGYIIFSYDCDTSSFTVEGVLDIEGALVTTGVATPVECDCECDTTTTTPDPKLPEPNGTEADQTLTIDDTAGGVQFSAFHADTTQVFWTLEGGPVRVTFDGSAPTITNGHLMSQADSGLWSKATATAAKFIRTTATDGVIHGSQMI